MPSSDPVCSAVVIAIVGGANLERCIAALAAIGVPITIVGPRQLLGNFLSEPPSRARCIEMADNVPARRAVGIQSVSSEWVLLIEDTCVPDAGIAAVIRDLASVGEDVTAISGPVCIAKSLAPASMALGCTEYGEYRAGSDKSARPITRIHGLCSLFRRRAVTDFERIIDTEVHAALLARGGRFQFDDRFVVEFAACDSRMTNLASRYAHGRLYGGIARYRPGINAKVVPLARCLLLPVVLTWRAAGAIPASVNRSAVLVQIAKMSTAWACGEAVGAVRGPGDASLREWQ